VTEQHHDSQVADLLEWVGEQAPIIATVLGRPAGGVGLKALLHIAAERIRSGVGTAQIAHTLRHINPLESPWGEAKRVGRDPT
jgi:hypothetical protein